MPRKRARKRGPKGAPWYRSFNDTWYFPKIDGQARPILDPEGMPVKGKDNREKAYDIWHQAVARDQSPTKGLDNPLRVVFEEFLDYTERHREFETYDDYKRTLQSFKDKWPDLTVNELSVRHVEAWFDDHPDWSETTRWCYVTVVLAALNWAAKPTVKLIPFNPIKGLERPRKKSRGGEARVSEETHKILMARVPWDFKQILMILRHTGTRPSNICRVTARNFFSENGVWMFDASNTEPGSSVHKTFKKTGKPLIVPLTAAVVELCEELVKKYPTGPLFRTRRGHAWTPNNIVKHFRHWRKVLLKEGKEMPDRVYAYCYRHQLATDLLERGEPDTQVAALLGHQGTRMLHQHYSGVTGKSRSVRELLLRNVTLLPEEATVSAEKVDARRGKSVSEAAAGSQPDAASAD
jgi:integrase